MKHTLLMIVLTLVGTVGTVTWNPVCGVFIYYLFAVLRPQFIWDWELPVGIGWSSYVAYTTLAVMAYRKMSGDGIRLSAGHYSVLAFGCWIVVTYFTAQDRNVSEPYLIEYLKIFLMYYAASQLLRTMDQAWSIFLMTGATLGYISFEINDIYFRQGGYMFLVKRGYSGMDNNGAGLMLAMGVPLCYFAWEGMTSYWRWIFLGLIPIIIHAVLMSFSRGAMLSLLVSTPFFLLRSRHKTQVSLALLAVACMIPFLAGQEIRNRFFSISKQDADESAHSRLTTWNIAWHMALEKPIFGFGIRNSNLFTYERGADIPGRAIHSQYLQTAADSGLVALGLYLVSLILTFLATRRIRRTTRRLTDRDGRRAYAIAAGVDVSMITFCVGAVFLSMETFELPYILMLLGVQVATIYLPVLASGEQVGESEGVTAHQYVPAI